jgi:hypothetical protein
MPAYRQKLCTLLAQHCWVLIELTPKHAKLRPHQLILTVRHCSTGVTVLVCSSPYPSSVVSSVFAMFDWCSAACPALPCHVLSRPVCRAGMRVAA